MQTVTIFLSLLLATTLAGCSYLSATFKQARLFSRLHGDPGQRVYKHMLPTDNFFVFGQLHRGSNINKEAIAVIAVSNLFRSGEVVDICHYSGISTFYGLNLPVGAYQLLVVSDMNRDGFYDEKEIVGGRLVGLDSTKLPDKVLGEIDIDLDRSFQPALPLTFRLPVKKSTALAESIFYPKGSIRTLDDEIFSARMTTLGMYEPAVFLEEAPMMFYALEEDLGYKVPVVFVHGIGGGPRDFAEIIHKLDRRRYRPWFFYYPSGYDLGQLSEMFYKIFLSGKTIELNYMPMVIVAHSMGGLVVRDALNRFKGNKGETHVVTLITIASPLGGHPAASQAATGPVVLPSWRDVAPDSDFMQRLRRQKLPRGLEYHLLYAFGNETTIKFGENSDGVVPLSSQLCSAAQRESTTQFGCNDTHTGILKNPEAIARIITIVANVKPPFPDDHLREFDKGGYDVKLDDSYPKLGRYCIRAIGRWLEALAEERIKPIDRYQVHFVEVCRHNASPDTPVEKAWLRFIAEFPDRSAL